METYSALWGPRRATLAWLGAMACTLLFATLAARAVGAAWIVAGLLGAIGIGAVLTARRLIAAPVPGAGKRAELLSGLWTIAMYLGVGVLPLVARL